MRRIDGEWRQNRKDVLKEVLLQPVPLPSGQVGDIENDDSVGDQFGAQSAPPFLLGGDKRRHPLADVLELLGGSPTVVGDFNDPRENLTNESGHPNHEEFVKIVGRDRQKAEPLEQRMMRVRRLFQHPPIELQPRKLAVDEPFRRRQQRRGLRFVQNQFGRHGGKILLRKAARHASLRSSQWS